jgi:DNA-binding CsgD family transcriptional regulator
MSLSNKLRTITSAQPDEIRARVVDAIRTVAPRDVAIFADSVRVEDREFWTNIHVTGDDDIARAGDMLTGAPVVGVSWLPSELEPGVVNRFVSIREFYDDDYLSTLPIEQNFFRPLRVRDQLRAVMFDGDQFIGWIGLARRGTNRDRFRPGEVARLQRVASEVKAALVAARAVEDENLADAICAVFAPEGRIEHASMAFSRWLSDDRESYLRTWVRRFDAGHDQRVTKVLAGAQVRMLRMDGPTGVRYMVTVDRAQRFTLDRRHWLTPRQLEVAELAIAGATNAEIARYLGISGETVKSHIKNIYRRLHVGTRAELAALLSGG